MNEKDLMLLTDEAEIKAYLAEVGRQYGKLGLLQVANGLVGLSEKISQRALWCIEAARDVK